MLVITCCARSSPSGPFAARMFLALLCRILKQSFHSHCGARGSSFPRKRESSSLLSFVGFSSKAFTRLRRASHFLLLVQEKVTKEKHALGIALFGLLPEKYASATCVPLSAHPCARSGIGAIHRAAPAGIAAAAAAMQKGTREQRASCAPEQSKVVQGWTELVTISLASSVAPEHRRLRRKRGCQHMEMLSVRTVGRFALEVTTEAGE